ncbi:choice-of-anchor M domain-containing protein [Corynebacterium auris]|uniref:choice-of-anchor M domain-containing protein n=1 Tax=Corynebacterium auris TaxID=44750 RepID=UPI0025B2AB41|nr:choice-of-anchor M domain-containing protein [Corynebacterium auris]WJY67892.1 hypothetical protein CAURIS_04885 [Corynebacterium auris]
MKRLASALLTASLATTPLFFAPPAFAAEPSVCGTAVDVGHIIRNGHQDLRPQPGGGVVVRDEGEDRNSGEFSVAVPGSTWSSIDYPSLPARMYYLSSVQKKDLPWFGFSAEDIATTAEISFASVEGPGRVLAWVTPLGEKPRILLDSASPRTAIHLNERQHLHVEWGFTEPGAYSVTFNVAFGAHRATLNTLFLVGDDTLDEAERTGSATVECVEQSEIPPLAPEDDQDGTGGPSRDGVDPAEITRNLNALTREFTALDKAWGGFTSQVLKEIYPSTTAPAPTPAPRSPATRSGEPTKQSAPARSATAKGQSPAPTSLRSTSVAAAPAQQAPAQKAPAQKAPAQKAPAQKAPAQNASAQQAASQSGPTTAPGAEPIPDAAPSAAQPPAQPVTYAAPETQAASATWQQGTWWAGLVLGLGIASLFAGVLFFFSARRVLSHLDGRG